MYRKVSDENVRLGHTAFYFDGEEFHAVTIDSRNKAMGCYFVSTLVGGVKKVADISELHTRG